MVSKISFRNHCFKVRVATLHLLGFVNKEIEVGKQECTTGYAEEGIQGMTGWEVGIILSYYDRPP